LVIRHKPFICGSFDILKCLITVTWQAEDGVGIPEEVLNDTRFERAMSFYFMYLKLDWLWFLNLLALILLNFLEVRSQKVHSVYLFCIVLKILLVLF
jgi:hypothetical protein